MRVLLVTPAYPPSIGGVERHVSELAIGLAGRGVQVEIATCDPKGAVLQHRVEGSVEVHRFPTILHDGTYSLSPSLGAWLLRNAGRFDLIHGHSYHAPVALEALVAAHRFRRPFVLTPHYHGTGHTPFRKLLHVAYRPFGRVMVQRAKAVICVSRAEEAHVRSDFGDGVRTALVPNGVDVDAIIASDPIKREKGKTVALVAGRLERYKQVGRVIEAMAFLPGTWQLVVIGDGLVRDELAQGAAADVASGRIRFLGLIETPELRGWLRAADVFATLSRHEAFGIGLLEAAVAGAGVVASNIPAHREVAGFLPESWVTFLDPDAPPERIAEAMLRSGRHPVVQAAVSRVPTWTDTVDGALAVYERVLGSGLASRRSTSAGDPN
jgi:glycosyltransferase involved in cell wall biosynthesis